MFITFEVFFLPEQEAEESWGVEVLTLGNVRDEVKMAEMDATFMMAEEKEIYCTK